jgi:hypothetical protein
MTTQLPKGSTARGEIDKEAVEKQLECILEHPTFRGSARSSRFLRYVVEYWLEEEHHGEQLKERTLGVALFGLDPAYDTTQNTVVRNAAVDVRKRLVLYYLEPGHADEIQIALHAGSYLPQISLPAETDQQVGPPDEGSKREHGEESTVQAEAIPNVSMLATKQLRQRNLAFLAVSVLISLAVGASAGILMWRHWSSQSESKEDLSSLNQFWQPVLNATPPEPTILVCVGQLSQVIDGEQVAPLGNAFAVADIARLFALEGAKSRIDVANAINAEQLQTSTVILIGGLDNIWTAMLTEPLRFHFLSQTDAASQKTVWIEDRKNPGKRDWSISNLSQSPGEVNDYAIVARFKDPKTGQWRVVVSGVNDVGTNIASRILTGPNNIIELTKHLPAGWDSKNIEVVFRVKIVNGKFGYPEFVAYDIW